MHFPEDYFEDEVRDGFFITSMMKRSWAAQLEVLEDIDALCQKYNIKYYGDCGTLIGAVRHGGYIPWDDDLDICLLRDDYERLLEHAHELPENYTLLNWRTHEDWTNAFSRIVNTTRIRLDEEFMEKYHGFPYSAGVDIFVLDYMYEDADEEEERRHRADMLMKTAGIINIKGFDNPDLLKCLKDIEDMLNIKLDFNGSVVKQLYSYAEKAMMEVKAKDASKVCFMAAWIEFHFCFWDKKFCNQFMRVPFECSTIPIPVAYDEILKVHYGDYMKVNRSGGLHEYPCYAPQEKFLMDKLGRRIWEYQWDKDEIQLRNHIKEEKELQAEQLKLNIQKIEALIKADPVLYGGFQPQLDSLKTGLAKTSSIKENGKEEVVFFTLGPKQWKYFSYFWHKERLKENTEVFVIPISYFDTSINGQTISTHYITEGYDVPVLSIQDYDISKRHPNRIYIQCPYDHINPAMTVHNAFYSDKLLKYTDELIYVPMYDIKEYHSNDAKTAYTLNYLVKTPVVLHADKIFLPSQSLKEEYIKILVDFSKGDTDYSYWDKKIDVEDFMNDDVVSTHPVNKKKTLLYYSDVAPIALYGNKSLKKICSSLNLLKEASERLNIIWLISANTKDVLNSPDCHEGKKLYSKFINIVSNFKKEGWGMIFDDVSDIDFDKIDAYAGNPSPYAHYLSYNKKPVMILKPYDD